MSIIAFSKCFVRAVQEEAPMCKSDRERATDLCNIGIHQFEPVYYGDICKACGLFVPDGCGWWLFPDEDGNYFEGYGDDEDE
jgi:hypothetical protein